MNNTSEWIGNTVEILGPGILFYGAVHIILRYLLRNRKEKWEGADK